VSLLGTSERKVPVRLSASHFQLVQRGENAKRLILFAAPRIIKKALGVDLSKAVQTKSLIKRTPQRLLSFLSKQQEACSSAARPSFAAEFI
jgi:hypothetical protein